MDPTSHTLIEKASAGVPEAWQRLDALYRPFIASWLTRHGVPHHDAEELTQEVLTVVYREMAGFAHSGHTGAFRHWLRQITLHRAQGYWRSNNLRRTAGEQGLDLLEDSSADLTARWDREHDAFVLTALLKQIAGEFEPTTIEAFRRVAFLGQAAAEVAHELGVSTRAVYIAKSRVLRRLREEARGLVDETRLA